MHRTNRPHRLVVALAVAGVLGLTATKAVRAAPITGYGVPIDIEQPSLGVTYLVRTRGPDQYRRCRPGGGVRRLGRAWRVCRRQWATAADHRQSGAVLPDRYDATAAMASTTFALPNLSGRSVVGTGQGAGLTNRPLGSVAGAPTQTLTASSCPLMAAPAESPPAATPLSTLQPSLALNEGLVTQGFFPVPNGPQAQGPVHRAGPDLCRVVAAHRAA